MRGFGAGLDHPRSIQSRIAHSQLGARRPEGGGTSQGGGGEIGVPGGLEHRPRQIGPAHAPGRQPGHVPGQRRGGAGGADAVAHTGMAEIISLLVAVQGEQDLRRLAAQLRAVEGGEAGGVGEQSLDAGGTAAAGDLVHRAIERGVSGQVERRRLAFLGHRHHAGGGFRQMQPVRRRRRRGVLRQAHHQQSVHGPRIWQSRPLPQPILQIGGAGMGGGAEIAIGQNVAEHVPAGLGADIHGHRQQGGGGDIATSLQGEDTLDLGGFAGWQRLRQSHAREPARIHTRNREGRVVRGRLCLRIRLRDRSSGQNRCPGEECPGCGKAVERIADRSHDGATTGRCGRTQP